ncbi:MAG: hypothetical protein AAF789_10645 [Bacteroidota bacterium]
MKLNLFVIVLIVVSISCSQDDESVGVNGSRSKVVGDYIYYLLDGDQQEGSFGGLLEEIRILKTDFQGNVIPFNVSFSLSDESGSFSGNTYYSDTIKITWKLGCSDPVQYLTVTDENVCGLNKNKCIPVDIFDIEAKANSSQATGWLRPCLPVEFPSIQNVFVNGDRIFLLSNDRVYSSSNPAGFPWIESGTIDNFWSGQARVTKSGRLYIYTENVIHILSESGLTWATSQNPYSWNSDIQIESTNDGEFFMIGSYDSRVFASLTGSSWSRFLDLETILNNSWNSNAQALAVGSDSIYIATSSSSTLVTADINNAGHNFWIFPNTWSSSSRVNEMDAFVAGNHLVLKDRYYTNVISLSSSAAIRYEHGYDSRFMISSDQLYIGYDGDRMMVFNNQDLISHVFNLPPQHESSYYSSVIGMYFKYPVFWSSNGITFYKP